MTQTPCPHTKQELVAVAERLFTEHGYAGTSLDSIVTGAKVTKGALYHHFTGKQSLFEAVFWRVEEQAESRISQALEGVEDPWTMARRGLRTFLEIVQEPTYRRVVSQDAPAVMGMERFRESEEHATFGLVRRIVQAVLGAGDWELDQPLIDTFSRIFFGALSAAGGGMAVLDDPDEADRVEAAVGFLLSGLRMLAEHSVPMPGVGIGTQQSEELAVQQVT